MEKDYQKFYTNIINGLPVLEEILRLEPSLSGCDATICGASVYFLGIIEGMAIVLIPISIGVLATIYKRRWTVIHHLGLSQSTIDLNRMLHWALSVHLLTIAIFLVIPMGIFIVLNLTGKLNYMFDIMLVVLTSHSVVDIPALMYFVKPYRKFIVRIWVKLLKKMGLEKLVKNRIEPIVVQVQSSGLHTSSFLYSR